MSLDTVFQMLGASKPTNPCDALFKCAVWIIKLEVSKEQLDIISCYWTVFLEQVSGRSGNTGQHSTPGGGGFDQNPPIGSAIFQVLGFFRPAVPA